MQGESDKEVLENLVVMDSSSGRRTVIATSVMAVFAAGLLATYVSAIVGLTWGAATVASLCAAHAFGQLRGRNIAWARAAHMVSYACVAGSWQVLALLLWRTHEPLAEALAAFALCTLSVLSMFHHQRNPLVMKAYVISCMGVLALLFASSAWQLNSPWRALAVALFCIAAIAALLKTSATARVFGQRLKSAMDSDNASRKRLAFAIESAGDGYFEIDLGDMIYRPNPKLSRSLGFDIGPKDVTTLRERLHDEDAEEVFAMLARCVAGDLLGWDQDVRIRVAGGGYRWMNLRARLLEQDDQRVLLGTVVDLSARKQMEAELRAARDAAEASNRSKSEFLANMSHEIRTPLNGVLGMAQALQSDELSLEQSEKVAIILDSGNSLTALLNDVLDLSKIEAGKLEVSAIPGDLVQTMERIRQLFAPQAEEKGLVLSMRFEANLNPRLIYDPLRVRQCVSNLMSNAIKFTPSGQVGVAIAAKPLADGAHLVSIKVTDSGIGMSPRTLDRLFSAFTQADGGIARKFGGSGLGLAISRQLARLMGGDVTVTSVEGKGSTFHLTFRAQEAVASEGANPVSAQPAARLASSSSLRGKRVLLTDDNAVNRQVIRLFLAPQGCDIVEATNGQEALDALDVARFDIVLLDVHMPVMDGKEAILRLRAAKKDWCNIPVIALTADAMTGDREKYIGLGMTDYVSKPIDQRELVFKMQRALNLDVGAAIGKTGT